MLSDRERLFVAQCGPFVRALLTQYGYGSLDETPPIIGRGPVAVEPVVADGRRPLSDDVCAAIRRQFTSESGVAYFVLSPAALPPPHPLLNVAQRLRNDLNLFYPVAHPLEQHRHSHLGEPDETVKIYSRSDSGGAMSTSDFALHQDGLGNGGHIEVGALYMDQAPIAGGYTYFQNYARIALELAKHDWPAFESLFLPNALTICRATGSRAIKITGPVLYLGASGLPSTFLRVADAEYSVYWRSDITALVRARRFLEPFLRPLADGSAFVRLTGVGHGCFWNNRLLGHGRTAFSQSTADGQGRVLSRKWWASGPEHQCYRHYPGLSVKAEYAELFPEFFSIDLREGEWRYDRERDHNVRIA
jgi:hypothetical protein